MARRDTETVEREGVATGPRFERPPGAYEPEPERRNNNWLIALLTALLIGAIVWAIIATIDDTESQGPEAGVTLSDLGDNGEELVGSQVVVSGQIAEIVSGGEGVGEGAAITAGTTGVGAFTLGNGQDSVLVVGSNIPQLAALTADADVAEGDIVQVSGVVRQFDIADFESELGGDLNDQAFGDFDGQPAIVASAVDLVPTSGRAQGENVVIDATDLADNPQEFLGQVVSVNRFVLDNESDIISPRAFALSDQILVIGASGPLGVQPGFAGTIDGTLIEASTAQLLPGVNVPNVQNEDQLFEELGFDEQQLEQFQYVLLANRVTPTTGG